MKKYFLGILLVIGITVLVCVFKYNGTWYKYEGYQIASELKKDVILIRDTLLHHKFGGFISVAGDSLYLRNPDVSRLPSDFIKSKMDKNEVRGIFIGEDFIFLLLDGGDFFGKSYGLLCTERLNPEFSFVKRSRLLLKDPLSNEIWFFIEANL